MPIGMGFSVAQRLRGLGLTGIPLVFITASKVAGLSEAAKGLGAVAFFEKPYDPEQLLEAVSRALESRGLSSTQPSRAVAAPVC